MLDDINLIPQTEIIEQKRSKIVSSSTIFSIVILLITLGISAYLYTTLSKIDSDIKKTETEIESLRSDIKSMADIEVAARNLDKKYNALRSLFNSRVKYSLLLKEFEARKPSDVSVQSFDVKTGQISVSGTSGSYISVKNLMDNLLNREFQDGNPSLKDVFTSVSLNSVNLDKSTNDVKFLIVITYQERKLQGL